jgi:DNA-binding protein H-NS
MAKPTLQEIQAQVAHLQSQAAELGRQAAQLRAQEVAGVVERIRGAITAYGLTERDIFGRHGNGTTKLAKRAVKSAKVGQGAVRFRDEAGNTWGGRGRRPDWVKAAIKNGTSLEDLIVRR